MILRMDMTLSQIQVWLWTGTGEMQIGLTRGIQYLEDAAPTVGMEHKLQQCWHVMHQLHHTHSLEQPQILFCCQ